MILVKDIIEWAKRNAIGRSASYPDGAIRSADLLQLATDCLNEEPMTYEPKREGQAEEKWEDIYVVYRRIGQDFTDLMASDMTIDNAILFVKAWFQENYNDQETSIEIHRQPMDYHREV